jgi:acyl-CoA synthetase (AMP-forming)/AMP-acid ligase II
MVPRTVETVASLALTPNGKVDYKRLAADRRDV